MLSAESGGIVYYSGRIHDPKSRSYTCRVCELSLTHVNPTTRTMRQVPVVEHFRHQKGESVSHPEVDFSWQAGEITQRLIDTYSQLPDIYEFDTDRVYSGRTHRGEDLEFAVNFTAISRKTGHNIAFFVHGGGFNAKEAVKQLQVLARQDVSSMIILAAQGELNENGKYFQLLDDFHRPKELRKIPGNEKSVYDRFGYMVYFDHDEKEFFRTRFRPFIEYDDYAERDVERKTFKYPVERGRSRHIIPEKIVRRPEGLLVAQPWFPKSKGFEILKDIGELRRMKREGENTAELSLDLENRLPDDENHILVRMFLKS